MPFPNLSRGVACLLRVFGDREFVVEPGEALTVPFDSEAVLILRDQKPGSRRDTLWC